MGLSPVGRILGNGGPLTGLGPAKDSVRLTVNPDSQLPVESHIKMFDSQLRMTLLIEMINSYPIKTFVETIATEPERYDLQHHQLHELLKIKLTLYNCD